MRFDIVTIFPGMVDHALGGSILGRAREKEVIEIHTHDLRSWTHDRHHTTDDYPYGGGAGMVMKVEPFAEAVDDLKEKNPSARVALMTPQGSVFNQEVAKELSTLPGLIILCGRYEGVDERVRLFCDMEISLGDFVLTGGEIPAMAVVDAVARLVPGVVGKGESVLRDSHSEYLLEHPHYTRPAEFRGVRPPETLFSGDHKKIEAWRREQSIIRTARRRPDLIPKADLTDEERLMAERIIGGDEVSEK